MTAYENWLAEADSNGLITKEKKLLAYNGRIKGNRIAINCSLSQNEKKCVLAEELGHYYTGVGDILDQTDVSNQNQELRGRFCSYNKVVGLLGIIEAYKHRCQNLHEMAEYLEVPEDFLMEALNYYRGKYGRCTKADNYIIFLS